VPLAVQQPLGQLAASQVHVPFVVSQAPFEHAEHAAPAAPHWAADCDP
jgi:hypothetical protein